MENQELYENYDNNPSAFLDAVDDGTGKIIYPDTQRSDFDATPQVDVRVDDTLGVPIVNGMPLVYDDNDIAEGITPRWTSVRVFFSGNGHTHGSPPATQIFNTPARRAIPSPGTMSRTGFNFVGWELTHFPADLFHPGEMVTFEGHGDIFFQARWTNPSGGNSNLFQRRISSDYHEHELAFFGRNIMNQNRVNKIIIHNTGISPRDIITMHNAHLNNDGGFPYHFLISYSPPRLMPDANSDNRWVFRTHRGTPLNLQAPHAFPVNDTAIGIAIAGNYQENQPGDPVWGSTNLSTAQMTQVRRCLEELIADCLLSYPSIARQSRVGLAISDNTPASASGIMRHADVSAGNPGCPGPRIQNIESLIRRGINIADAFDGAELLRTRFILPSSLVNLAPSVHWARNANAIQVGSGNDTDTLGELIARMGNFSNYRNILVRFNSAASAIDQLARTTPMLIFPQHVLEWRLRVNMVPHLSTLLMEIANRTH
jgi:hypothetical protein